MATQRAELPALNGGLNLRDLPQKLNDNQSPDMLNMWFHDRVLSKRWGQEYVTLTTTLGAAVTLGTIRGISTEYEGYKCIHAGTKLYKWDEANNYAIDLGVTVANVEGFFLEYNGLLYHNDGTELRQISTSYAVSTVVPYKPLTYLNCAYDFSNSDANEAFNLIGAGFKVWYDGDGSHTAYTLPVQGLDATAVEITVDGVTLTENTNFTVDRTNGTINFAAGTSPHGAPAATAQNNVVITAYKTVTGAKAKITGCKVAIAFGGESTDIEGGTRAFLMKNSSYKQTYWYSDLGGAQSYGFTYWPDTQYEDLIQNNEAITAAAKQGGELIIFKERSLFAIQYMFDGENVYYPVREFNSSIGCDMPKSVQLIDNCLTFANTRDGVFRIVSTENSSEDRVKPISGNINGTALSPGLLQEANLTTATSIDYDRKYWLCVGSNVYIWDYEMTPYKGYTDYEKAQRMLSWFKLSDISAAYWSGGQSLYYGTSNLMVKFNREFSDFDTAIEAYWTSKAFDFGLPDMLKTIISVVVAIKADTNSTATFTVSSEQKTDYYTKYLSSKNFTWRNFTWPTFGWAATKFAKAFLTRPKMKKVVYCQIKIYNNTVYADLGATDLVIEYMINGRVKR